MYPIYNILVLFLSNLKRLNCQRVGHLRERCQQSSLGFPKRFHYLSIKFENWYLKIARDCRDTSFFATFSSISIVFNFQISQPGPYPQIGGNFCNFSQVADRALFSAAAQQLVHVEESSMQSKVIWLAPLVLGRVFIVPWKILWPLHENTPKKTKIDR